MTYPRFLVFFKLLHKKQNKRLQMKKKEEPAHSFILLVILSHSISMNIRTMEWVHWYFHLAVSVSVLVGLFSDHLSLDQVLGFLGHLSLDQVLDFSALHSLDHGGFRSSF